MKVRSITAFLAPLVPRPCFGSCPSAANAPSALASPPLLSAAHGRPVGAWRLPRRGVRHVPRELPGAQGEHRRREVDSDGDALEGVPGQPHAVPEEPLPEGGRALEVRVERGPEPEHSWKVLGEDDRKARLRQSPRVTSHGPSAVPPRCLPPTAPGSAPTFRHISVCGSGRRSQ